MINVKNLIKSFPDKIVLDDITFDVSEEEALAIVGFSGSGKSTILKVISGLEPYESGSVETKNSNIAMVFQYSALFDSLSVLDNVAFALTEGPLKTKKLKKTEIKKLVSEKLKMVGLSEIEDKFPSELSGGMQKRVAFARAIVTEPKIILYDEPTAGLDPVASTVIEDYITRLKHDLGAASIVVTHQMSTITRTSDRVIMLYDGKIVWSGTPQEMLESNDPYAKQFVTADRLGPMHTAAG